VKQFLQGSWLGHPLHPILVHIPTALWPAALVFDLLTRFDVGGNPMVRASFYAILFGLVAALAAAPAGLADWWEIKPDRPARKIGIYHMSLNAVVTVLFLVNLLLRLDNLDEADEVATGPLLLSAIGVAILAVSGYLGGRMVYDYGIAVARYSKGRWRRIAEAGGARVPEEG
jgi:uncharacterized membrane protein